MISSSAFSPNTATILNMGGSAYSWLLLLGIAGSLFFWSRLARKDERLLIIYVAALVSAFLGAKLVYLAAEGWMFWDSPQRWLIWATGKTILGALLGGYVGVEVAKKLTGYRKATGDWFALVAPMGILSGRIGCLLHGCCLGRECAEPHWWTLSDVTGVPRWPAVPAEIAFNVLALGIFLFLNRRDAEARRKEMDQGAASDSVPLPTPSALAGQHFHLYLMGYGLFRFGHEFLRATPRVGAGLSGYHVAALAVVGLGLLGFLHRRRQVLSQHDLV